MKKIADIAPKKIAVFRALQLGDTLCAIPAIRALKMAYPAAKITLIGLPWSESFVKRFSEYFSGFIHFPGYPGLPEQDFSSEKLIQFIKKVKEEKFDLLLQMHGNGSIINPLIQTFGVQNIAGFRESGKYYPDTNLLMEYPENIPEIERHLGLMKFLEIPLQGKDLEFPIKKEAHSFFRKLSEYYELFPNEYVCIHPGARDKNRRWPIEKFAQVADLISEKGYTIVFTGTGQEQESTKAISRLMKKPSIDLTGKTELGILTLLIQNAKMLFSNDTGVSHLAAAVKTPSVIIFLTSDPDRWGPLDKNLHRRILRNESENINYIMSTIEEVLDENYKDYKKKSA